MKPSIFYISTRGHSASQWLTKMLSKHPQVVCFSSARSFPPRPPSIHHSEISADVFMEALLVCVQATYDEKIFGSIHAYHGTLAKEACEKRGGLFSYIVRHPISRVHCAYIYYLETGYYQKFGIPVENKNIHPRVCGLLADSDLMSYTMAFETSGKLVSRASPLKPIQNFVKKVLPNIIIKNLTTLKNGFSPKGRYMSMLSTGSDQDAPDEKEFMAFRFVTLVDEFLRCDYELFESCSTTGGIKMEEMVKSHEYFKDFVWPRVAPQVDLNGDYLKLIFDQPRFNVHRDKPLSPSEIWESWPAGMKEVFMKYFEVYNIAAICKAFNYDISFL